MEKPEAKILGADGNIFTLLAIASSALKKEGLNDRRPVRNIRSRS